MNSEKVSSNKIISQKEYLKRYLSKTKTKTKKKPIKRANVKVIDDNDLNSHQTEENFDLETGEDAPVIAAVIDERPKTIQRLETYKTSDRWAPVPEVNDAISENSFQKRNQRDHNEKNHIYDDTESRHDSPIVEPRSITHRDENYKKHRTSKIDDSSNAKDKSSGKLQNSSYRESSAVREETHSKNTKDSNSLNTKELRRRDTLFPDKKSRHQKCKNSSDESLSSQRKKHSREGEQSKSGKLVKDKYSRKESPSPDRRKSKDKIKNRHRHSSDDSSSPQKMRYHKEEVKLTSEKVSKGRYSRRESHSPDRSKPKDRKRDHNTYSSDENVSPQRTKNLKNYEKSNSKKFNEEQHSPNSKSSNRRKDHDTLPVKKKRSKYSSDSSPSPDRRLSEKKKKLVKHSSDHVSRERRDYSSTKKKRDSSSSDCSLSPSRESRRKKKTHESNSDLSPSHDSNMKRKKKKNRRSSPRKKVSKRSSSSSSFSSSSSHQNDDRKNKRFIDKRDKYRENKSDSGVSPERNRDYSKKTIVKNASSLSVIKKSDKYLSDRNSSRDKYEKNNSEQTGKSKYLSSSSKSKSERHDRKTDVKNDENKTKPTAEQYYQWGKGLKQIEDENEKLAYTLHEMSKPLARYADDEDLDKHLRNMERDGDPLAIIRRNLNDDDSADGAKPKYKGTYPQNRFGIPPGHKWDGVDRSNGYEVKWLGKAKAKEAVEEEAYKWSTEDM